jgi:hypothetical protein
MTQKRDLKRRVRERQGRTGESYTTALRHVRGEQLDAAGDAAGDPPGAAPPAGAPSAGAIPVVELVDMSDLAESLGLTCRVMVMPALIERVDPAAMLVQLRGVLRATAGDPAFAMLRAAVLLGERPSLAPDALPVSVHISPDNLRFAARVRAGVGGISSNGRSLAFSVAGRAADELVVFGLWLVPQRPPALLVTTPDQLSVNVRFGLEVAP